MIDYNDNLCVLCRFRGSAWPKALLHSLPAAAIAVALCHVDEWDPDIRKESGIYDVTESQLWNAMTAVIAILLGFRVRQALGRFWEGTSLLHQMRGEWFDAASCLVSFSRDAKLNKKKDVEVNEFRHTLVRLISLMHGSALDEICGSQDDKFEVLDIHGIDVESLRFLRDCATEYDFNRVEALQHMIQVLVTHNHHIGVLTIPPPILSRVFQTLSRGYVNLLNAKKIKDTCFPFPFAQIIRILLIFHSIFTPVLMTQIIENQACAAILSFLPMFGMFGLNNIAGELEMPFGSDTNDLPLHHFQDEMNQTLLLLVHEWADHLPHTSKRAVIAFRELVKFKRKTMVSERGDQASDSKSFLQKDFFDADVEGLDGRFSNVKCVNTGVAQSLDFGRPPPPAEVAKPTPPKAEVTKPAEAPKPAPPSVPLPVQLVEVIKPPPPEPAPYTLSAAAELCAPQAEHGSDIWEILAEMRSQDVKAEAALVKPVIDRPGDGATDAELSNTSKALWQQPMFARCCSGTQERIFEISRNPPYGPHAHIYDCMTPAQLSAFFETWMRKTDLLIQELRINSARLDASTKAFGQATPQLPQLPSEGAKGREDQKPN